MQRAFLRKQRFEMGGLIRQTKRMLTAPGRALAVTVQDGGDHA